MKRIKSRKSLQVHIVTGLLIIIAGAGILLSGCVNSDNTAEAEENAMITCAKTGIRNVSEQEHLQTVEYEHCTLSFSFWGDEVKKQETEQKIRAFEEEFPGITIETVDGNSEGWEDTLIQRLQTDTASDINQIEWEWLHKYSADGALFYDLYREHQVLQLGSFGQEYLNLCTVAEELQAVPANLSGKVFYFNENLFARAGIGVPETLDELIAAGEIFRTKLGEEYYPLALTIKDRMELLVYYLQSVCGKDWVVDGVLQYYVEDMQKGTEFLLSLEEAHVIPSLPYARSDESHGRDAGWNNGFYGGVFVSSSVCEDFTAALPAGDKGVVAKRFADMGTKKGGYIEVAEAYSVSESCAHKREAALFLDYLLIDEVSDEDGSIEAIAYEPFESSITEADFFMNYDYAVMIQNDSLYNDIFVGLSYGDYNAREAAQLLMDSFSQ